MIVAHLTLKLVNYYDQSIMIIDLVKLSIGPMGRKGSDSCSNAEKTKAILSNKA